MVHLLLFTIILAMAILSQPAFAQLDSCNMTLLDEWEIPNETGTAVSTVPFCTIDSFIIVANQESTHVLKIDSLDNLVKLTTHSFNSSQILARDSILYVIYDRERKLSIFDFNNPYSIDSIGSCVLPPICQEQSSLASHLTYSLST